MKESIEYEFNDQVGAFVPKPDGEPPVRSSELVGLPRTPATVWPVGSFILDEMQERGWSIEELTKRMDGSPETQLTVEILIHAPTPGVKLDEQTASLLAAAFGASKKLWLKLDETWQSNDADQRPGSGASANQ